MSHLSGRLGDVIPAVPTAAREFAGTDNAAAFMRIYQGTGLRDRLAPVAVTATVVDASGRTRGSQTLQFAVSDFAENRTANCRFTLPVARLESGEYLLTVEATLGARTAGRALRFRVK